LHLCHTSRYFVTWVENKNPKKIPHPFLSGEMHPNLWTLRASWSSYSSKKVGINEKDTGKDLVNFYRKVNKAVFP
jgi:hypothetical protein